MLYLGKTRQEESPATQLPEDWAAYYRKMATQTRDGRLQRFYQQGMVEKNTPLQDVPMVALDFETTGLNPDTDGIVSIGLVPMSLQRIRCSGARHWVVKPRQELSDESIIFHRITHSEIEDAPDFTRILDELLQCLAGKVAVVHHRGIERPFLDKAMQSTLGEGLIFPVIDTMELEARIYRSQRRIFMDRLLRRRPTSIRLADSRARYHLPFYNPHHALTDAIATGELLQAQVADRFSPSTPVRTLWK